MRSGLVLVALLSGLGLSAREITYPEGSDIVIDVTQAPYNADPTGVEDAGPIIQAAVLDAVDMQGPAGQEAAPIVYLPNGRYRIATPIVLETETPGGQWRMLQGQSRDGVILFSDANDPDLQDAENPVALVSFFEGEWTNNAFTNLFENFTVEIAAGNPGAVGVRFHGNNVARLENVLIRSLDPDGVGRIGLDLKESISAPGIIKHVDVEGFDIGIDIANPGTTAQAWTIDEVTTHNQNEVAIQSHRKSVQITDWVSVNTVPAYISQLVDGMVTLINVELRTPNGETSEETAITMNGDLLYLRNVAMSGYATLLDDNGVIVDGLGEGESYRNGPVYSVWEDTLEDFAHLPIVEIPDIPWDDPEEWEVVYPTDGDDTEAIQAALLSGAETVFLYPGLFEISNSLRVGPNVQRIASNWARIQWRGELFESGGPIFIWEESNHEIVTIERIAANWWQNSFEYMLHNATDADMVLRDNFWVGGGVYRNEPTNGRLFVENTHNVPGGQVFRGDLKSWVIVNQDTWARQFNPEMAWPLLTVDGGTFWVSGFKFGEQQGPVVIAKNQAVVEFQGGYMNVTHGVDMEPLDVAMIETHDAQVSIRLIERAGEIFGPPYWNFRHRFISRETRLGETRELSTRDDSIIHRDTVSRNGSGWGGAMVPLYSSMLTPASYPDNAAPTIQVAGSSSAGLSSGATLLAIVADDGVTPLETSVHWRKVAGPGAAYFEDAASGLTTVTVSRPGTYSFVATTRDGLMKTDSDRVDIMFHSESAVIPFARSAAQRMADLPPRNGEADTALISLFLQAGDFSISGNTPEQELRVQLETSITSWSGQQDSIQSATLYFTPRVLNTPPALQLVRTKEVATGLVSMMDYSDTYEVIEEYDPSGWEADVPIEVDVTDALKAALSEGNYGLGLQLRSVSGPNDDGVSNYMEIRAANPSSPETDPRLEIQVDSELTIFLSDSVAWLPDGNGYEPLTGFVYDAGGDWWYSYALGRFISVFSGSTADSAYLFTDGLGWCWTSDTTWPYLYQLNTGTWYLALLNSPDYWFFNLSTSAWEQIPPQ